jgi:hypothetical protein
VSVTPDFSSAILVYTGSIDVMDNRLPIGMIAAPEIQQKDGEFGFASPLIPAELLVRHNELTFELKRGTVLQGGNPADSPKDRGTN